jgi:hypothetical protein
MESKRFRSLLVHTIFNNQIDVDVSGRKVFVQVFLLIIIRFLNKSAAKALRNFHFGVYIVIFIIVLVYFREDVAFK